MTRPLFPALPACIFLLLGCSPKYVINSYPPEADVYIQEIASSDRRAAGKTPITLRKNSDSGEVFFFVFEKEKFRQKKIIIKPSDGKRVNIDVKLEPLIDYSKRVEQAVKSVKQQQKERNEKMKMQDKLDENIREATKNLDVIDKQLALYKSMLFDERYSQGVARYDRMRSDIVAGFLSLAEFDIRDNKLDSAEQNVRQAVVFDENSAYSYYMLGVIYAKRGMKDKAYTYYARAKELDPGNPQFNSAN